MKPIAILLLLLLPACAEGGEEDRPQSEVQITASHHLYSFRSLRGFETSPVPENAVFTDRGTLNLFDDSSYTVTRPTGTSAVDSYAIENTGVFSVLVTGTASEPSVAFQGGYSLLDNQNDFFFTDRVSTPSSPSIGIWFGTREIMGQVELEGAWHLLSLHAVFGQSIPSPENVARGAHGDVMIEAGAPGTSRMITGSGMQGTSSLVFGGTIQNLLDAQMSGDGTCNLTVDYQLTGQAADSRVMLSAANDNVVYGLDADESDGEAGLLMMIRKFDAPATPVDSVRVPGRFLIGGHTFFINPSNAGSDTFVGLVTLSAPDGFLLEAVGNTGADFSYSGTYALATDGGMTLTISGTNETWHGAIDRSYNTFAFVDDFEELRANNIPELNFGIGVRESPL